MGHINLNIWKLLLLLNKKLAGSKDKLSNLKKKRFTNYFWIELDGKVAYSVEQSWGGNVAMGKFLYMYVAKKKF
jgi:hypothetical protein